MIGLPTHFLVHAGNGGLIRSSAFGPWVDFQRLGAPFAHPAILSRSSQVPGLFNRVFQAVEKAQLVAGMKAGVLGLPSPLGRASGRKGALGADR